MGKFILKDADISVNSVDFSNFCSQVTVETTFDEQDVSGFGGNYREYAQGLGDATITLTVFQDFAAASVDATLWPLSQSGDSFPITVKPTSSAVSATNPAYTMTGRLFGYNPIDGAVGDASTTDVTLRNADQAGLTRDVTP